MVDCHLRQDSNIHETELERLRSLVVTQGEQLQQKDEELLQHRQMYHGSSPPGNASNPYQPTTDDSWDGQYQLMIHSTMTWMCELLLSITRLIRGLLPQTRTSRRTALSLSPASLQRQARCIRTTNAIIICILFLHFWQCRIMRVHLPEPSPVLMDSAMTSKGLYHSYYTGVQPWTSIPPTPIHLMDTKDARIMQRHQCLAAVRNRQQTFFQEYFDNSPDVLLVDPAYHSNVGDVMLSIGELQLIQGTMQQQPPKQCHYIQSNHFYPLCDPTIHALGDINRNYNKRQLALWHAGGNWGDLWRDAQDVRIPSLATLLENRFDIISMPQSLYYEDPLLKETDIDWMKSEIATGLGLDSAASLDTPEGLKLAQSRVVLTWREKESLQEANELYPFVRNVLLPDIAFQLGPYQATLPASEESKRVDILLFLRDDKESKVSMQRDSSYVQRMLPRPDLTFRIVDWSDRLKLFNTQDYLFTESSIQLLALGNVVICDR